jgi:hypothetical protein
VTVTYRVRVDNPTDPANLTILNLAQVQPTELPASLSNQTAHHTPRGKHGRETACVKAVSCVVGSYGMGALHLPATGFGTSVPGRM